MSERNDSEHFEPMSFSIASYEISPSIYNRVDELIYMFKHVSGESITKQDWFSKAIKEKLKNENDDLLVPKKKVFQVKIDDKTNKALSDKIEHIKKFRKNYSKKQWILEAIQEKLAREEMLIKKIIKEAKNSNS